MSQPVCRVGDSITGTCNANAPGHPRIFTGSWITGSGSLTNNGIAMIRQGDTGLTDCGHNIVASAGSAVGKNEGLPLHRVGDSVIITEGGSGVSTTGSNTWSSE